jgi:DNA-directed RNA polymerase subunit RPC12/RpoP
MSSKRDTLTMMLNATFNPEYTNFPRAEKSDNYTCDTCKRQFKNSVKCTNFTPKLDENYCLDCLKYGKGRYSVGFYIMPYVMEKIAYDTNSEFFIQAEDDKNLEIKCNKCSFNLKGYAIRKKGTTDNLCYMCYFESTRGIINNMFAMSGKSVKKINKMSKRSQKKAVKSSQKSSQKSKKRYNKSR